MEYLCDELLLRLAQHLTVRERAVLAQVSRRFHSLLSDVSLWRDVAVTFSQGQVLLRAGHSAPCPVADIRKYSELHGSKTRSLDLTVSGSCLAPDWQVPEFLVLMEDAKLESLSLSLRGPVPHLSSFLKSQTSLRRARVASVCPRTSLLCLTQVCQSSASQLQELCWHYKPLRLKIPRLSKQSQQALQQLGRFSREGTVLLQALKVFCKAAGSCCKLQRFQTNVFSEVIWRHLVNSTYNVNARPLTVVLTVDESSTLSEPATATFTPEECRKFRVVLRVDSLQFLDVNSLVQFSRHLPICEMHVKVIQVLEIPAAVIILDQMAEKFRSSLTRAELHVFDHSLQGNYKDNGMSQIKDWRALLGALSPLQTPFQWLVTAVGNDP